MSLQPHFDGKEFRSVKVNDESVARSDSKQKIAKFRTNVIKMLL